MEIQQRDKLFGYLTKIILSLISLFLIYNIAGILFLSRGKDKKLLSNVSDTIQRIDSNLKLSDPKKIKGKKKGEKDEEVVISQLMVDDDYLTISEKKISIFSGPIIEEEKEEIPEEMVVVVDLLPGSGPGSDEPVLKSIEMGPIEYVDTKLETELVFRGVTNGLALISVRRNIEGQWQEQGFPMKVGDRMGQEKIWGGRKVNFITNCILIDLFEKAERKKELQKTVVNLDENGRFIGTKVVPSGYYTETSAKIEYWNEEVQKSVLWLGETAVITVKEEEKEVVDGEEVEEEPKFEFEDPAGKIKSFFSGTSVKDKPKQLRPEDSSAFMHNSYSLTPLADFEVLARVFGYEHYYFDQEADLSNFDLVLGWGPLFEKDTTEKIKVTLANRLFYFSVEDFSLPRKEIESNIAIMHFIPSNSTIARKIRKAQKGDIVAFKGSLVKAVGKNRWQWKSSLTRDDVGSGAAELVWVEEFEIVDEETLKQ